MKKFINRLAGTAVVIMVSVGMLSVPTAEAYENPAILLPEYVRTLFCRETSAPA